MHSDELKLLKESFLNQQNKAIYNIIFWHLYKQEFHIKLHTYTMSISKFTFMFLLLLLFNTLLALI